jgi:DNA-binding Xre family transcriptional regulator
MKELQQMGKHRQAEKLTKLRELTEGVSVTPTQNQNSSYERVERPNRVAAIKAAAESTNNGRSYLLRGLWACRLAAGLTQRELADAMGGSQATVGLLERGCRGAYLGTIARLCGALGVAPEDLLSGDGPSKAEAPVAWRAPGANLPEMLDEDDRKER